jgi:hypothetical protein
MKKILNILVVFSLVFFYSCDQNADFDTEDQATGTALLGGGMVDVRNDSEGKLLGVPSSQDFTTATVAIAESILDLEMFLLSGGMDVVNYDITKSINSGNDVVVASSSTLPLSLSYSTTEDFINGLGISASDLRIGDVITFRTKMTHSDGRVSYSGPNDGTYKITVSCSSNLGGLYDLSVERDDGAVWPRPNEVITETGVGVYTTTTTGGWSPGQYGDSMGFTFEDICGELTVPNQALFQGMFSNEVEGTIPGIVSSIDGGFTITYTIMFSGSPTTYINTYVKL